MCSVSNSSGQWVGCSVILLLHCAAGLQGPPYCDPDRGECGGWFAVPYFITFGLIISVIMLNLFTAVIIENFEKQQEQVKHACLLGCGEPDCTV